MCLPACAAAGERPGTWTPFLSVRSMMSPAAKRSGWPGEGEVALNGDAAAAIGFDTDLLGEVVGLDAGGPDDGFGFDPAVIRDQGRGGRFVEMGAAGLDVVDARAKEDFDAEVLKTAFGVFGEFRIEGFEEAVAGLDEDDIEIGGVDVAEIGTHGKAHEVGEGAREFDAGGAAADE